MQNATDLKISSPKETPLEIKYFLKASDVSNNAKESKKLKEKPIVEGETFYKVDESDRFEFSSSIENNLNLQQAAEKGNVKILYNAWVTGQDPNATNELGESYLQILEKQNHVIGLVYLLNASNQFSESSLEGALLQVLDHENPRKALAVAKVLLQYMKDHNLKLSNEFTFLESADNCVTLAVKLQDSECLQDVLERGGQFPLNHEKSKERLMELVQQGKEGLMHLDPAGMQFLDQNQEEVIQGLLQGKHTKLMVSLLRREGVKEKLSAQFLLKILRLAIDQHDVALLNVMKECMQSEERCEEMRQALKDPNPFKVREKELLCGALQSSDPQFIEVLLNLGVSVDQNLSANPDLYESIPLVHALKLRHYQVALFLADHLVKSSRALGLCKENKKKEFEELLCHSVLGGCCEVVQGMLEEARSNQFTVDWKKMGCDQFVIMGLKKEIEKKGLSLVSSSQLSPLYLAVQLNNVVMFRMLVEGGADVNLKVLPYKDAFEYAVHVEAWDIMLEILKKRTLKRDPKEGLSTKEVRRIVELCAKKDEPSALELFSHLKSFQGSIDWGINGESHPVIAAGKSQKYGLLKALFQAGAPLNARDSRSNDLLKLAILSDDKKLFQCMLDQPHLSVEMIEKALLDAGKKKYEAKLFEGDQKKKEKRFKANQKRQIKALVDYAIDKKLNIDLSRKLWLQEDYDQNTILHHLVRVLGHRNEKNRTRIGTLIEKGSSVLETNREGEDALALAIREGKDKFVPILLNGYPKESIDRLQERQKEEDEEHFEDEQDVEYEEDSEDEEDTMDEIRILDTSKASYIKKAMEDSFENAVLKACCHNKPEVLKQILSAAEKKGLILKFSERSNEKYVIHHAMQFVLKENIEDKEDPKLMILQLLKAGADPKLVYEEKGKKSDIARMCVAAGQKDWLSIIARHSKVQPAFSAKTMGKLVARAVGNNDVEELKYYLRCIPNPHLEDIDWSQKVVSDRDVWEESAGERAVRSGQEEILKQLLIAGLDPTRIFRSPVLKTPLEIAWEGNQYKIIDSMFQNGRYPNNLFQAISSLMLNSTSESLKKFEKAVDSMIQGGKSLEKGGLHLDLANKLLFAILLGGEKVYLLKDARPKVYGVLEAMFKKLNPIEVKKKYQIPVLGSALEQAKINRRLLKKLLSFANGTDDPKIIERANEWLAKSNPSKAIDRSTRKSLEVVQETKVEIAECQERLDAMKLESFEKLDVSEQKKWMGEAREMADRFFARSSNQSLHEVDRLESFKKFQHYWAQYKEMTAHWNEGVPSLLEAEKKKNLEDQIPIEIETINPALDLFSEQEFEMEGSTATLTPFGNLPEKDESGDVSSILFYGENIISGQVGYRLGNEAEPLTFTQQRSWNRLESFLEEEIPLKNTSENTVLESTSQTQKPAV